MVLFTKEYFPISVPLNCIEFNSRDLGSLH